MYAGGMLERIYEQADIMSLGFLVRYEVYSKNVM